MFKYLVEQVFVLLKPLIKKLLRKSAIILNIDGVHVRRGDMAVEGGYWEVVPAKYFINVCNIPELQDFTFISFQRSRSGLLKMSFPI